MSGRFRIGGVVTSRLFDKMNPKPDGESPIVHRSGVVDAVNADGTVDLELSGVVVEDVAVLSGAVVAVDDVVQVAAWAGDLLVLGKSRLSNAPTGSWQAKARVSDDTGGTIANTETEEIGATIAIPTDWNTYALEADFNCDLLETGTLTGTRSVTFRLRLTDTAGALIKTNVVQLGQNAPNRFTVRSLGFLTGQGTTGNVVVIVSMECAVDNAQASWDNGTLIVTADRAG
jgi:hypothetical protein